MNPNAAQNDGAQEAHDSRRDRPDRVARSWVPVLVLAILAAAWIIAAVDLVQSTSPTIDELPHAASGWAIHQYDDFRVNPEHPPLWKRLGVLVHPADALPDGRRSPLWTAMPRAFTLEWAWSGNLLYGRDPADGIEFIRRSRLPVLAFGFLLGAVIVAWCWRLAGPAAAILGGALFALEPNLLAHSALLTSDVPFTATMIGTFFLLSLRASTIRRVFLRGAAAGLLLGLCLVTKFTALILPPLVAVLILLRPDQTRRLALGEIAMVALTAWVVVWAAYDFRYAPGAEGQLLDLEHARSYLAHRSEVTGMSAGGVVVSFAEAAARFHLLPQAFSAGLLWAKATSMGQPAFMLGEISPTGWWWYFPFALSVKTATIVLFALVAALFVAIRQRLVPGSRWDRSVLLLPPLAVLIVAMVMGLNIGVRHVLPVIPAVIITSAVVISSLPRKTVLTAIFVLIVAGGVEIALVHPHHLSYFNLFAGGSPRGIDLLGDSNLDWGQDLERLGRWREENPCTAIHLAYYGSAPPEAFGVSYSPLPVREPSPLPDLDNGRDEVLIVSTRYLQGLELHEQIAPFYRMLRETEPTEVIGTTLWVYRLGPQASCAGG